MINIKELNKDTYMKQLRITRQLSYGESILITSATINRWYNEGVNRA